jgi:glycosyltransferase involved in cell wall biosynthesis
MATWDVFALSSLSEGTSVTLLEAMASRLPVVATDVGGNPEIVEDGMTGRLVPRGGVQEMAEALEAVLLNPDLAKRYGAAGRTRVQERFTEASMMSAYQGIYRDLLKEGAQ